MHTKCTTFSVRSKMNYFIVEHGTPVLIKENSKTEARNGKAFGPNIRKNESKNGPVYSGLELIVSRDCSVGGVFIYYKGAHSFAHL